MDRQANKRLVVIVLVLAIVANAIFVAYGIVHNTDPSGYLMLSDLGCVAIFPIVGLLRRYRR